MGQRVKRHHAAEAAVKQCHVDHIASLIGISIIEYALTLMQLSVEQLECKYDPSHVPLVCGSLVIASAQLIIGCLIMLVFHCGGGEECLSVCIGVTLRPHYALLFRHLSMILAISKHSSSLIVVVKT
jgi:hypothetical protein